LEVKRGDKMGKEDDRMREELLERHTEAVGEASRFIKDVLSDEAYGEFLRIAKTAARSRGGVYISSVGEKSKVNAAIANVIAAQTDPKSSYLNFSKGKGMLEDIYQTMKGGEFKDRNLLIIADPGCKKGPDTIRKLMKREIDRLMKETREEKTKAPLPKNIIYLKYVRDKESYLEKVYAWPFNSTPGLKPAFRKRPNSY
jgi:hypothetical protein